MPSFIFYFITWNIHKFINKLSINWTMYLPRRKYYWRWWRVCWGSWRSCCCWRSLCGNKEEHSTQWIYSGIHFLQCLFIWRYISYSAFSYVDTFLSVPFHLKIHFLRWLICRYINHSAISFVDTFFTVPFYL